MVIRTLVQVFILVIKSKSIPYLECIAGKPAVGAIWFLRIRINSVVLTWRLSRAKRVQIFIPTKHYTSWFHWLGVRCVCVCVYSLSSRKGHRHDHSERDEGAYCLRLHGLISVVMQCYHNVLPTITVVLRSCHTECKHSFLWRPLHPCNCGGKLALKSDFNSEIVYLSKSIVVICSGILTLLILDILITLHLTKIASAFSTNK